MRENRHDKIGIKQTIQRHWMDRVLRMLLAGLSETEIRNDLIEYLATQKQSGGIGERGDKTYRIAIGMLGSWFSPLKELSEFRDESLEMARILPEKMILPLHWAVISASYPFWFKVAEQVGRLLNLQDQVTQLQIFGRLKELYGDRETVARNARYTVRSFVAWQVLKDSLTKGSYKPGQVFTVANQKLAVLMLESALHATREGKGTFSHLSHHPALFPFYFPNLRAETIARHTERIEVVQQGFDDSLLILKRSKTCQKQSELMNDNV